MLLQFFPDTRELSVDNLLDSRVKGAVARELERLEEKHKDLALKVWDFLKRTIGSADELQVYYNDGHLFNLTGGLHEMRIPKTRKGGVFRIYFCFKDFKESSGVLVLLDAELKHKREAMRINSAREKLRQYKKWLGGKNE